LAFRDFKENLMEDRRIQIPTQCWVNIVIIDRLQQTSLFKQYCVEVPRKGGFKGPESESEWPFMNLSWGAYMMYCLVVVPKELYNLPKDDPFYIDLQKRNVMQYFTITKERETFAKDPRYHLKKLRNAISHVNFTIDAKNVLTFWDHRKPNNRHWEARATEKQLLNFLRIMADATHRVYVDIRNGKREIIKGVYQFMRSKEKGDAKDV